MKRCIVLGSETGGLKPLIVTALNSASVTNSVTATGAAHPMPIIARAWNAVDGALLKTFDELKLARAGSKDNNSTALMSAYQEFLYRAAEFVEAVEKQLRPLTHGYKVARATDRLLSEQCNAIKHEGMRVGMIWANTHFFRVYGYQIRHHVGSGEASADRFHKKRPSYSFNLEIRRLYAAMYLLGEEAGRAVIANHGTGAPPTSDKVSETLKRVLELPAFIFPGEVKMPMPQIKMIGPDLHVSDSGGPLMPLSKPYQIGSIHSGDGFTRTFGLGVV